jgi:hypothetical protein
MMKMIMDKVEGDTPKCALCSSPAAKGSILCKSCRRSAKLQTWKLKGSDVLKRLRKKKYV